MIEIVLGAYIACSVVIVLVLVDQRDKYAREADDMRDNRDYWKRRYKMLYEVHYGRLPPPQDW